MPPERTNHRRATSGSAGRGRPAGRLAGAAAVLVAAALWGSTGTVAHFAPAGASPVSIGAARIVVGGTLLVLFALWRGRADRAPAAQRSRGTVRTEVSPDLSEPMWQRDEPGTPRSSWAGRILRGRHQLAPGLGALAVAGYQVCFFSAVRLTGVAIGTVVAIGSGPVFAGVISRLTGTASLSGRWMVATGGAIAGCAVLLTGGRAAGVDVSGACLALLAGLCYATYAVAGARVISGGEPERSVMATMFGGGAVLLLPVLIATSPGWMLTWRGAAVVGELGVLTTAIAYLLYGRGLRTVQAPVAVTLGLFEPVVAALLALVVLGERLTATAVAGVLLVGAALAILAWPSARSSPV
jgi:drug/metabolite transporter, DME family